MFSIKLRNENASSFWPLPAGSMVPYKRTNPYWIEDANLQVPFSYPFSLIKDPVLWRKLDFPDMPGMVSTSKRIVDIDLLVARCLHLKTKLKVLSFSGNRAEVNLYEEALEDLESFKTTSIRDLVNGETEQLIADPIVYFELQIVGEPGTGDFVFSYNDYSYSMGVIPTDTIDSIISYLSGLINADTGTHGLTASLVGSDILRIVDSTMWENELQIPIITASGAGLDHIMNLHDWLGMYHDNFGAAMYDRSDAPNYEEGKSFNFFPSWNPNFYGEANPDYLGYVNYFEPLTDRYYLNMDSSITFDGNKYTVVPFVYARYIWDRIFEEYGISVEAVFPEGFEQLMIWNTYSLDRLYAHQSRPYLSIVTCRNTIEFSKHIPDMTISEFLYGLKILFNLAYDFDSATMRLKVKWRNDLRKNSRFKNWTSIPFRTAPEIKYNYGNGIKFESTLDSGDEYADLYAIQPESFSIGEGHKVINCPFSWPNTEYKRRVNTINPAFHWKIPVTGQQGSSDAFEQYAEFGPRLIFYRGMSPEEGLNQYPYATNDSYDSLHTIYDGTISEDSFSMTLIWSKIVPKYWDNWIPLYESNAEMDIDFHVPVTDLLQLEWEDQVQVGNNHWFVKDWEIIGVSRNQLIINIILIKSLIHTI